MELPTKFYRKTGNGTISNFQIPATDGVYFFFDKDNKLIYVGSSLNMRKRIAQHFGTSAFQVEMVNANEVKKVSFIIVFNFL